MQGTEYKVSEEECSREIEGSGERAAEVWESFEELFERMRPRFRAITRRYRVPPGEAEDLVQEALLTLVAKSRTIRNPEAWLVATLQNRCLVYWRKVLRREEREVRPSAELEDEPRWEESLEAACSPDEPWLRLDLERALETLPEGMQELIRLRYEEGRTHREVAERLGYSRNSPSQLCTRALRRLRRYFESCQ